MTHEPTFPLEILGGSIVNNRTGELLDLGDVDHADLAAAVQTLQETVASAKTVLAAMEDELVRRHGDRRHGQVVGDHEIDVTRSFSREWDVDDLIETISYLATEGQISVTDVQGLVKEELVHKPDGTKLAHLLRHLERFNPEAHQELAKCFTWKAGKPKVKITPVIQLTEETS